jgi:N-acetyl-anhydromuramyl-L-alanine amidase AmpD
MVNLNDGKDPFPPVQVEMVQILIARLKKAFPELKFLASHASISPGRKSDPAGFPLAQLAEACGLSLWL